jgi:hypothetical protein
MKEKLSFSRGFVNELMNWCLNKAEFWPELVIDDLIRTNMVATDLVPDLLSTVIERQSYVGFFNGGNDGDIRRICDACIPRFMEGTEFMCHLCVFIATTRKHSKSCT